ncbi:MAG: cadmium carbonic anhydrase [Rhodobacter sp.]|nr:cadmium carbonic anhydrase [Rhodobacter sp.]
MRNLFHPAALAALGMAIAGTASAQVACILAGPQTPRDISSAVGRNTVSWPFAPAPTQMNLCDIHTHTNAEHKGPGFSVFAGDGVHGGYKCNDTEGLSDAERADDGSTGTAVRPGDTIEVHWVHTTCDVAPAPGLGSCLCDNADTGVNQQLRVETQVFLVVNDRAALDFSDFMHDGHRAGGYYQPKSLPADTGDPVQFLGSTTGPGYNSTDQCSSPKVTWSVRPQCARVDVATVNAWFAIKGDSDGKRPDGSINVFRETESQGIRQLVVNPALLAPIE